MFVAAHRASANSGWRVGSPAVNSRFRSSARTVPFAATSTEPNGKSPASTASVASSTQRRRCGRSASVTSVVIVTPQRWRVPAETVPSARQATSGWCVSPGWPLNGSSTTASAPSRLSCARSPRTCSIVPSSARRPGPVTSDSTSGRRCAGPGLGSVPGPKFGTFTPRRTRARLPGDHAGKEWIRCGDGRHVLHERRRAGVRVRALGGPRPDSTADGIDLAPEPLYEQARAHPLVAVA